MCDLSLGNLICIYAKTKIFVSEEVKWGNANKFLLGSVCCCFLSHRQNWHGGTLYGQIITIDDASRLFLSWLNQSVHTTHIWLSCSAQIQLSSFHDNRFMYCSTCTALSLTVFREMGAAKRERRMRMRTAKKSKQNIFTAAAADICLHGHNLGRLSDLRARIRCQLNV